MKKIFSSFLLLGLFVFGTTAASAQSVVPAKWLVTANQAWFNGASNLVRGMAFNTVTNHVLVASRDVNAIVILNSETGDSIGAMNMTGISGGTFIFNRVGVSADGRIYTTNLVTSVTKAAPLKIYTWADETSAPVVAFADSVPGVRQGDAIAVVGSGQETYVYVSGSLAPGVVNVFKRSADTLVHYKSINAPGWNFAVTGIGPMTNGFGPFWLNASGKNALSFDTLGNVLDTIPGTIVASSGSSSHYFEFAGRKYVGVYSGNASVSNPSVARFADVTVGDEAPFLAGVTTALGTTANSNATGEVIFSALDTSVYVLSTNNGVGKYDIKLAAPVAAYNSRFPHVPANGENDTVYMSITSMKPITSVKLIAYGNPTASSDQAVMDSAEAAMAFYSGRLYSAVVPASLNRDGRRIDYRVEATDNMNVTGNSATFKGYFAGLTKMMLTNGPRDIDSNRALLYSGYGIRSKLVVTAEDSVYQTTNNEITLQDQFGGVTVFKSGTTLDVQRYNEYTVTGTLSQFNGKLQFVQPGLDFVDMGPVPPISPIVVTIKELIERGEELENMLVEIRNVSKTPSSLPWPAAGADNNMTFIDASGDSATMRVDRDTEISGTPEPNYPVTIVGVAGQFDNSSPFTSSYQWLPRDIYDIIQPLHVGLMDTTAGVINTNVVLPVMVGPLSGVGITAFHFTAKYDSTALQFVSATTNGTLSNGFSIQSNVVKNGLVEVAASGVTPLQDSGVVFNYQFKILKTGASMVELTGSFNEGNPLAIVHGGVVVGGVAMETEPNDSMSVANPVMLGEEIHGNLSSAAGDPDFFSFDAPIGHLIVDVTDVSNATDADIYLYNAAGTMLYNVDRNSNDRLEYNITAAGKYYVKVAGYLSGGTYATGPYKMLARIGPATDPNEPNDGPLFGFFNIATPAGFEYSDTTNTLDPGVGIPGNDYDYFRVIAAPGQTITAIVQGKTHFPSSTLNSIRVRLFRKGTFPTMIVGQDKTDGSDVTITHAVAVADTYYVRVFNIAGAEAGPNARYKLTIAKPTGVLDEVVGLPKVFALEQNYPNPFNPSTAVRFALPSDASVRLTVYDILGREVRMLVNEEMKAGYHLAMWDGKNNFGTSVSSGVYIYRIEAGTFISTKKMMLMK